MKKALFKTVSLAVLSAVASWATPVSGTYSCYVHAEGGKWKVLDKAHKSFSSEEAMIDYLYDLVKGAPREYYAFRSELPDYGAKVARKCDKVSFETDGGSDFEPFVSGNTIDSMQRLGDKANASVSVVAGDVKRNAVFVGIGSRNFALGGGWVIDRREYFEKGKSRTLYSLEAVNWKDWLRDKIWQNCLHYGKPPVILENPWAFVNNAYARSSGKDISDMEDFYRATGILFVDDEHICDSMENVESYLSDYKSHYLGGTEGFGRLDRYGIEEETLPLGGWLIKYPYAGWSFDDAVLSSWFVTYMKDKGITKGKFLFDSSMSIKTKSWKKKKRFGRKKIYVQKTIETNATVHDVFLSSLAFPFGEAETNPDWNAKEFDFVGVPEILSFGNFSPVEVTPMGHSYSYVVISNGKSAGGFSQKITKSKSGWSWLAVLAIVLAVAVVSFFTFGSMLGWALGAGPPGTVWVGSLSSGMLGTTSALFVSIGSYTFAMSFTGIAASFLGGIVAAAILIPTGTSYSEYSSKMKEASLAMVKTVTDNGNFRIEKIVAAPAIVSKMEPAVLTTAPIMRDMVRDSLNPETRALEWNDTYGTFASFIIYENRKAGDFEFWGDDKFYELETKFLDGVFLTEERIPEERERYIKGGKFVKSVMRNEWK